MIPPWITTQLHGAKYQPISRKQELALFTRLKAGDNSVRALIVNANLKFVVAVAIKYAGRGLAVEDLIAEGSLGLQRAVDRFDLTSGYKFISYAVWWVRQAILVALGESGRVINLPPNRLSDFYRVSKAKTKLYQKLNREPSQEELAEEMNVPLRAIQEADSHCAFIYSLDAEYENDVQGETMQNAVSQMLVADVDSPEEKVVEWENKKAIAACLENLSEIDRDIVLRYFGIKNETVETLEDIAGRLGVTRERIRQRKEKSMASVKRHARALNGRAVFEEALRNRITAGSDAISIGESRKGPKKSDSKREGLEAPL